MAGLVIAILLVHYSYFVVVLDTKQFGRDIPSPLMVRVLNFFSRAFALYSILEIEIGIENGRKCTFAAAIFSFERSRSERIAYGIGKIIHVEYLQRNRQPWP